MWLFGRRTACSAWSCTRLVRFAFGLVHCPPQTNPLPPPPLQIRKGGFLQGGWGVFYTPPRGFFTRSGLAGRGCGRPPEPPESLVGCGLQAACANGAIRCVLPTGVVGRAWAVSGVRALGLSLWRSVADPPMARKSPLPPGPVEASAGVPAEGGSPRVAVVDPLPCMRLGCYRVSPNGAHPAFDPGPHRPPIIPRLPGRTPIWP